MRVYSSTSTTEAIAFKTIAEPVSVLMPVCNEWDIIEDVIREWHQAVFQYLPAGSELVFDDCSTDGTRETIYRLQKEFNYIRVNESTKDGFFKSCIRLYKLAKCPLVFFTDSDGQYVPEEFWKIASEISKYDMVHGAKENRHDPMYRIYSSKVFNFICRIIFGIPSRDINSAFRLVRKKLIDDVVPEIQLLTMLPNTELYVRAIHKGYRIKNIGIGHRERKYGVSRSLPLKVYAKECWRAFKGVVKLRKQLASNKKAAVTKRQQILINK